MSEQTKLLLGVALNTAIIYLFLIVAIRVFSRRQLGQLSVLDLLILILLGSAVETAMVQASTSLKAGLVSAGTLLLLNWLINQVMLKSRRLQHLVGTGPTLLVHNGKIVEENLKKLGMTEQDVVEALRGRECASIEEVRYAVFEPNGEVTVVYVNSPKDDASEGV